VVVEPPEPVVAPPEPVVVEPPVPAVVELVVPPPPPPEPVPEVSSPQATNESAVGTKHRMKKGVPMLAKLSKIRSRFLGLVA
jgi:hypothetical protein